MSATRAMIDRLRARIAAAVAMPPPPPVPVVPAPPVRVFRPRRSESKFARYITYIATPAATTMAIASAWPFIARRSRSSFRFSAETSMASP